MLRAGFCNILNGNCHIYTNIYRHQIRRYTCTSMQYENQGSETLFAYRSSFILWFFCYSYLWIATHILIQHVVHIDFCVYTYICRENKRKMCITFVVLLCSTVLPEECTSENQPAIKRYLHTNTRTQQAY